MKTKVIKILFAVVLCVVFGYAGRVEWADQVVYTMDETTYQTIKTHLGRDCSQYEIASEYMDNKKYYDGLSD